MTYFLTSITMPDHKLEICVIRYYEMLVILPTFVLVKLEGLYELIGTACTKNSQ